MRSLFEEMGELDELDLMTQKKLMALRAEQARAQKGYSVADLAARMRTSRNQVYRLLDPTDTGVTLASLFKLSSALGMRFDSLVRAPGRQVAAKSNRR